MHTAAESGTSLTREQGEEPAPHKLPERAPLTLNLHFYKASSAWRKKRHKRKPFLFNWTRKISKPCKGTCSTFKKKKKKKRKREKRKKQ